MPPIAGLPFAESAERRAEKRNEKLELELAMPLEKLSESVRGKKDAVTGDAAIGETPSTTDKMPVVPHKVLYADLPFYTDADCTQLVEDARICILRPLDPDGFDQLEIVPTSKKYETGQYLSWKLNKDNLWEECYYHNPITGQVETAWTMHVEFVGEVISDETVKADRERIEELEAQYQDPEPQVM